MINLPWLLINILKTRSLHTLSYSMKKVWARLGQKDKRNALNNQYQMKGWCTRLLHTKQQLEFCNGVKKNPMNIMSIHWIYKFNIMFHSKWDCGLQPQHLSVLDSQELWNFTFDINIQVSCSPYFILLLIWTTCITWNIFWCARWDCTCQ